VIAVASTAPGRLRCVPLSGPARLLRLELHRNPVPWLLPLLAALFWVSTYRPATAAPALWSIRSAALQSNTVLVFAPLLAGAAAWAGSREGRRDTTDLVGITALPRWAGRIAAWAAVTCWAEAAYLAGVAVLYLDTARQASWGGPLWWPVAVGAAALAACCALGFAAGAALPGRFTAALAAVVVFLVLNLGAVPIAYGQKYGQLWPLDRQEPFPDDAYGIFFRYVPDLAIAQLMFCAGLTVAALGALGLDGGIAGWRPRRIPVGRASATRASAGRAPGRRVPGRRALRPARGSRIQRAAVMVTIAGLAAAGTAAGLTGTSRVQASGIVIPALHDAASDRPVPYTPLCSTSPVPVCLHPAFRAFQPEVTAALDPLLREIAGLPGAPVRVTQVAVTSMRPGPRGSLRFGSTAWKRGVLYLSLAGTPLPGQGATSTTVFTGQIRLTLLPLVNSFVGLASPRQIPAAARAAQAAIGMALAQDAGLPGQVTPLAGAQPGGSRPGASSALAQAAAARRFLMLPAAARHAWLAVHLAALRAGQITLSEIP
jgi:hypothetical protein